MSRQLLGPHIKIILTIFIERVAIGVRFKFLIITIVEPDKGGNIMKSREEYIDKLAVQLKEWSAKIDDLQSKARAASADAKVEYENQIRQLKEKQSIAMKKLQELKGASAEAWDTLKTGAEAAWAELAKAVTAAKETFKKPSEPSK